MPQKFITSRVLAAALICAAAVARTPSFSAPAESGAGKSGLIENWDGVHRQRWVGSQLWANRLEDWEVRDGRLVPLTGETRFPVRTVHALTRRVTDKRDAFSISVTVSAVSGAPAASAAGFLIGAGAGLLDWRAAAIVHSNSGRGGGLLAWLETGAAPRLVFRDNSREFTARSYPVLAETALDNFPGFKNGREYLLRLDVAPAGSGEYDLALSLAEASDGKTLAKVFLSGRPHREIKGSFALAFSALEDSPFPGVAFDNFSAWGSKLARHPEREFGPVAGTLYSAAGGTLKLTAGFMPLAGRAEPGENFPRPLLAYLQIQREDGSWDTADSVRFGEPDYTACFRIGNWDSRVSRRYRVAYYGAQGDTSYYPGTIAAEPRLGDTLSVAGFTGMGVMGRTASSGAAPRDKGPVVGRWTPANVWFPFSPTVEYLAADEIDMLAFTGDQIYEGKPFGFDQQRRFLPLDYLYKWYLWHWAFGELTRNIPATVQVDDHDVYQGNVWGNSGMLNTSGSNSDGGYMRNPLFVQMVQRTQCWHNPDPVDPRPVDNGIGVYFTGFSWGGVSFALLEDRKFKSPRQTPEEQAILLGERQLSFLSQWATDWRNASVKVVISQSLYASMHTAADGKITADRDTGGWPPPGRDRAVSAFRKARAFVFCGDQHLSTMSRLGLEDFRDGPVQFCLPAIGNIFWRWFYPAKPGGGPLAEPDGYTGDWHDGFGNRFTMLAAANPTDVQFMGNRNQTLRRWNGRAGVETDSVRLCRGDGFGVLRIDTGRRTIRVECWPYNVPLSSGDDAQFTGWPRTFAADGMDGREPAGWLARVAHDPSVRVAVAVYDSRADTLIYSTIVADSPLPAYGPFPHRVEIWDADRASRSDAAARVLTPATDPGDAPLIEF
ncbi:MAG: hypothetical protein FVQ81_08265 [Candidatus Glassbacteria bacterium]|nr:hypothetical protein [Candidatus Glassbacteria bacterium]